MKTFNKIFLGITPILAITPVVTIASCSQETPKTYKFIPLPKQENRTLSNISKIYFDALALNKDLLFHEITEYASIFFERRGEDRTQEKTRNIECNIIKFDRESLKITAKFIKNATYFDGTKKIVTCDWKDVKFHLVERFFSQKNCSVFCLEPDVDYRDKTWSITWTQEDFIFNQHFITTEIYSFNANLLEQIDIRDELIKTFQMQSDYLRNNDAQITTTEVTWDIELEEGVTEQDATLLPGSATTFIPDGKKLSDLKAVVVDPDPEAANWPYDIPIALSSSDFEIDEDKFNIDATDIKGDNFTFNAAEIFQEYQGEPFKVLVRIKKSAS